MEGRVDGRTDGWKDGRMEGRTDGMTGGRTCPALNAYLPLSESSAAALLAVIEILVRQTLI